MIWAGYFFTVLNYVLYCSSRFCRSKVQMLTLDLGSKAAFVIGLVALGSMSGAASMGVSFLTLVLANIKERRGVRWPACFVALQAALTAILWFHYDGLPSIFIFMSSTIALYMVWWLDPQHMRAVGLASNFFTLAYNVSMENWAGLCELFVITSNALSYIKFRKYRES